MQKLDQTYWQNRYKLDETGWDAHQITTPLLTYFQQLTNKKLKILIPGAGNAHEAAYLHENGFENVYILDWAEIPLQTFAKRFPEFPKDKLICQDFFGHNSQYDLMIEQTFFCALTPSHRSLYVQKAYELLKSEGKLAGLLFNFNFEKPGPPFGGEKHEYEQVFSSHFEVEKMEDCYNSIPPRAGKELFIILKKKSKLSQ